MESKLEVTVLGNISYMRKDNVILYCDTLVFDNKVSARGFERGNLSFVVYYLKNPEIELISDTLFGGRLIIQGDVYNLAKRDVSKPLDRKTMSFNSASHLMDFFMNHPVSS